MERKLFWGIMTPGAVLTIAFGVWLWLGWFRGAPGWFHAKVALVALLVGYHLWCWRLLREFAADRNRRTHVWYRWFNEVPTVVLFATVILVVLKPF
jgi:putative membrane protein